MIRFGPSGNAKSFYDEGNKSTEQAPAFIEKRGLNAYEYSFGRGVNMGDEKAGKIAEAFRPYDIEVSVHAPYFINFATNEEEKAENSFRYVTDSAQKLRLLGGNRCIFHPASCGKTAREEAVKLTRARFEELAKRIAAEGLEGLTFCPETMGKHGQIGTIEEVVSFCKVAPFFIPCVDFGHINAFTCGGLKEKDDYRRVLDCVFAGLGEERAKRIHIHFSKIQYSKLGEVRHLTLADTLYGPEFGPLAELLVEYRMEPVVISESDEVQVEDAAVLKKIYETAKDLLGK